MGGAQVMDRKTLLAILFEQLESDQYMVDASKTTIGTLLRPFQLATYCPLSVIHLVRSPDQCLFSNFKRVSSTASRWKRYAHAVRYGLSWSMANLSAYLLKYFRSQTYSLVHYEQLIEQPKETLATICRQLNIDDKPILQVLNNGHSIPLTHQLSGNALRYQSPLFLRSTHQMSANCTTTERLLFRVCTYPVAKLLGY